MYRTRTNLDETLMRLTLSVFPGFLRDLRMQAMPSTLRVTLQGHPGKPRLAPPLRHDARLQENGPVDAARMMVPVSQVPREPPIPRAASRWQSRGHIALAPTMGAGQSPALRSTLAERFAFAARSTSDGPRRVARAMRLLLRRNRSSRIITEQNTRLYWMIEKGFGAR